MSPSRCSFATADFARHEEDAKHRLCRASRTNIRCLFSFAVRSWGDSEFKETANRAQHTTGPEQPASTCRYSERQPMLRISKMRARFVNNKQSHLPNPRTRIKGKRISGKGMPQRPPDLPCPSFPCPHFTCPPFPLPCPVRDSLAQFSLALIPTASGFMFDSSTSIPSSIRSIDRRAHLAR